jgi:hypothetical protein
LSYYAAILNTSAPRVILTPRDLKSQAADYFQWVEDHPLLEEKAFAHQGIVAREELAKCRAFSFKALASHMGLTTAQLSKYRSYGPEWEEAFDLIDQIIYSQKFENAAAGLLNATIIGRDLGLVEKSERDLKSSDGSMSPPQGPSEADLIDRARRLGVDPSILGLGVDDDAE